MEEVSVAVPDAATANLSLVIAIVAVATIGGFMFGYDSGVINGTQAGLEQAFHLTKGQEGLAVSALLLGCTAGAFLAGRLSDALGRRRVMLIAAALFIVSALGAGAAGSAVSFFIARVAGGMAVGAASVLSPAYISEVTPARLRGRLSSLQQVMIICGLTGAFVANYVLAQRAGGSTAILWWGQRAWRWMFWMQVLPASVFLATLLLIPESPRWLVARGRPDQAHSVLRRLFGQVQAGLKVMEIRASLASGHRPRLADLIDPATGMWRKIVWVGIGLAVFQQLVGINVIFYYGSVLWQAVGFTESDALKINIVTGALSIAACIVAIALIDRIGRKPLLLIGSIGMAVTLILVDACFATGSLASDGTLRLGQSLGLTALIAANGYTALFNFSWGPVMWVMLGEMFPNQLRGSALAVSGAAQWIANFAISASFPWAAARLGLTVTYGFYAGCALLSVLFVARLVRETKHRELEEMSG